MRLVINGDDFGYTKANTLGIVEGYRSGILRSTTTLANSRYLEFARDLAQENPGLGVGVHLTLTLGEPLTAGRSFRGADGRFLSRAQIYAAELDEAEVYEEWRAQIERFIEVFGREPTHLDSHHSVHDFNERQLAVSSKLAAEYGLQMRRYGDYEFVSGFYGPTATVDTLLSLLEGNADKDVEIMTHPGYCDLELYRASSYNVQRVTELDVLCDERVLEYMASHGVELVHY